MFIMDDLNPRRMMLFRILFDKLLVLYGSFFQGPFLTIKLKLTVLRKKFHYTKFHIQYYIRLVQK